MGRNEFDDVFLLNNDRASRKCHRSGRLKFEQHVPYGMPNVKLTSRVANRHLGEGPAVRRKLSRLPMFHPFPRSPGEGEDGGICGFISSCHLANPAPLTHGREGSSDTSIRFALQRYACSHHCGASNTKSHSSRCTKLNDLRKEHVLSASPPPMETGLS